MSEAAVGAPILPTEELIRFARSHKELVDRTRAMAQRAEGTWEILAKESNIPYGWIREFANARAKHTDIGRVCTLYLVLVGEQASN
jgi:hypothetical protein